MLSQLSVATLLLTFCHTTFSQIPYPNGCPEVKVMKEFDLDAYTGTWYEYSKYPFFFELGKKCIYAVYGDLGNNTVSVVNAAVNRYTNQNTNITGKALVRGPGQLTVIFPINVNVQDDAPNYIVLGTDYTTFSVVYSCTNFKPIAHTKVVWILTRERAPSQETVNAARKIIQNNNLSESFLIDTEQKDCPNPTTATTDQNTGSNVSETEANFATTQMNMIDKA